MALLRELMALLGPVLLAQLVLVPLELPAPIVLLAQPELLAQVG
jgi:hypothetical protein